MGATHNRILTKIIADHSLKFSVKSTLVSHQGIIVAESVFCGDPELEATSTLIGVMAVITDPSKAVYDDVTNVGSSPMIVVLGILGSIFTMGFIGGPVIGGGGGATVLFSPNNTNCKPFELTSG